MCRGRTSRESSTSVQLMSSVGVTNVDVLLLTGQKMTIEDHVVPRASENDDVMQ